MQQPPKKKCIECPTIEDCDLSADATQACLRCKSTGKTCVYEGRELDKSWKDELSSCGCREAVLAAFKAEDLFTKASAVKITDEELINMKVPLGARKKILELFQLKAASGPPPAQLSDASLQTRYDEQSKELAQLKAAQQPKDDVSTATVSNGVTKIRVQVHSEPYVLEVKLEFESAPTPTALFNKLRSGNSKMVIPAYARIYFEPRVPGSKRIAYTQDSAKFDWLQFACAADGIYIARLEVATPNTSPEKQAKTVSLNDQTLVSAINSIRKLHGPLVATPEICAFIRDYRQCGHAARWALLSTARMKMPFVGRDAQLLALQGKAVDYAAKWRARTGVWERKESTAFPTVFVSAGRGKSRLCVELEATLRTAANNGKFGDGPNDCTVVLSLSFLESALALYKDIKSPECAMGALLLAAYLRCGLDQGGFPSVSVASFLAALRQDLSCEGNLSVFVLLDEVNDVDPAKLGPLIKALVNSTFDAASATLVYPVLFGTHSPLKELDVSTSGCRLLPFSSDPLPLLTKSDVEQLLTTLASQSIDPADKEAFILRGDFKRVNAFWQLIDDVHGWPRGLEVVLREVSDRYLKFNEDVTLISINDVASAARQRIAELYLGNSSGEVLALPSGALKYALLGTTVKEEMHIPGTQITVHQFVSLRAQAALVDSKLVIPFLWLSAHASMRKLPALYKVWDTIVATDAEAMGWALFEQLCAVVLSLRLSVLADHHRDLHPAGPAVVSASELLAGVRWAQGKGLPAALAFTRDHEPDPTTVGTVTHQWPLSTKAKATQLALRVRLQTGYQVDLTSTACGVALVNAPSAPYADVFMPLRVQGQDKPVLLLLQCKWTNANKGITATTIWGEYKKCGDAWRRARLAEHFGSWIFVAVTSSPVEEELPTGALPLECGTSYLGCVSKANFRDFFGPTFASRAAISSRVDLDVNQMCQSDVQLALGVSSPAAAEIVRAREKARIRSASELLALVHEPKARERVASVCSRRVLLFDTVEP